MKFAVLQMSPPNFTSILNKGAATPGQKRNNPLDENIEAEWVAETAHSTPAFEFKIDILAKSPFLVTQANSFIASQLLPSSTKPKSVSLEGRKKIYHFLSKNPEYFGKRTTIKVNNDLIDVFIIGKKKNQYMDRWTLFSNGIGTLAEEAVFESMKYADELTSNLVFFNYPGVGDSQGEPLRNSIIASYLGMCQLIEEKMQAKEMILFGSSFGGLVQGQALKHQKLSDKIKYVFVKNQTATKISEAAQLMAGDILKNIPGGSFISNTVPGAIKLLNWEMDTLKTSKTLKRSEVIIQTAKKLFPDTPSDILHDGLFTPEISLATPLLAEPKAPNRKFIGVKAGHYQPYSRIENDAIKAAIINGLAAPIIT